MEDPQKRATGNGQPATGNGRDGGGRVEDERHRPRRLGIGAPIAQRMIGFASEVLRLARVLPRDPASRHVTMQIVRSATSVGANYEEARAAESPADFIHKLSIASKEVRETIFWLDLIAAAELTTADVKLLVREALELSAILGSSIKTARKRLNDDER